MACVTSAIKLRTGVIQAAKLARLAKQLTREVVIDHDVVNRAFAAHGGAKQLNKMLDQQLDDEVVATLSESL